MWDLLQREFRLCFYYRMELLNALLLFAVIATLFPLALSPDPKILHLLGPGVIWVAALLAMALSISSLFKNDYEDGSLDNLLMSSRPLSYYVSAKVLIHWLWLFVPLLFLTPLLGLMYQLDVQSIVTLLFSLLLGTPSLLLISGTIAALTITVRQNQLLTLLIALPLYVPILIFGVLSEGSFSGVAPLSFMAAILAICVSTLPVITASILHLSVRE